MRPWLPSPALTFVRASHDCEICAQCGAHESAHEWRCNGCGLDVPKGSDECPGSPYLKLPLRCCEGRGAWLMCPSRKVVN